MARALLVVPHFWDPVCVPLGVCLSRLWGFLKRIPESGLHIPGLSARDTGPVQLQARDVPELHAASQPRLRGVRE